MIDFKTCLYVLVGGIIAYKVLYMIINIFIPKDQRIIDAYEGKDFIDVESGLMNARYLGGFPDVSVNNKSCEILFFEDKIKFLFRDGKDLKALKQIPNHCIVSAEFATDTYIDQQISLGGLIAFGWVGALALRSNKTEVKEYVLLKYLDEENKERSVIFDYNKEKLLKRLIQQKKNMYYK